MNGKVDVAGLTHNEPRSSIPIASIASVFIAHMMYRLGKADKADDVGAWGWTEPHTTVDSAAPKTSAFGRTTMDAKAIAQARTRLQRAQRALSDLFVSPTFEDADESWQMFLVAAAGVYEKLRRGVPKAGAAAKWFAKISEERATDPLLSYIHHARNAEHHRLDELTAHHKTEYRVELPDEPGDFLRVLVDAGYPASIKRVNDSGISGEAASTVVFHAQVLPVVDRGVRYDIPKHHLGSAISDHDAETVGNLAMAYLTALVDEAEAYSIVAGSPTSTRG